MSSDTVQALSVRDLVRRRRGDDPDVWHLALVQRDVVWDKSGCGTCSTRCSRVIRSGPCLYVRSPARAVSSVSTAASASSAERIETPGSCLTVSNASTRSSRLPWHDFVQKGLMGGVGAAAWRSRCRFENLKHRMRQS